MTRSFLDWTEEDDATPTTEEVAAERKRREVNRATKQSILANCAKACEVRRMDYWRGFGIGVAVVALGVCGGGALAFFLGLAH